MENDRTIALNVLRDGDLAQYVPEKFKKVRDAICRLVLSGHTLDKALVEISKDHTLDEFSKDRELALASFGFDSRISRRLLYNYECCAYMLIHRAT